jgi:hypothetical protein
MKIEDLGETFRKLLTTGRNVDTNANRNFSKRNEGNATENIPDVENSEEEDSGVEGFQDVTGCNSSNFEYEMREWTQDYLDIGRLDREAVPDVIADFPIEVLPTVMPKHLTRSTGVLFMPIEKNVNTTQQRELTRLGVDMI